MFVTKKKAAVHQSPPCVVYEYGGTPDLGLAVAEIKGKYPVEGWARNKEVDMTYFVIKGSGQFFLEKETYCIEEGDLILIEKGKWYKANGKMTVVMASSPQWSLGQYEQKK